MSQTFRTQIQIRFGDADPAGIMYFGNIFDLAHTCFEEFIVTTGYSWADWFRPQTHIIPIRHAEADYLSPFIPGQSYDVEVSVSRLGETSFQMRYRFSKDGKAHGQVKMVHAVLTRDMRKAPLPEILRTRLSPYLQEETRG